MVEDIDKCASQPNISLTHAPSPQPGSGASMPNRSSFPPSAQPSLLSSSGIGSSPSLSPSAASHEAGGGEAVSPCGSIYDNDVLDNNDDLQQDIDSALAEVMSGLKSLETQSETDSEPFVLQRAPVSNPRHTPDLVLDLPKDVEPASPKNESRKTDSPTMTAAEVFVANDQCTIKKGASMPRGVGGFYTTQSQDPVQSSTSPVKRSLSSTATMNRAKQVLDKERQKQNDADKSPSLRRRGTDPDHVWSKKSGGSPVPPPTVPERLLKTQTPDRAASASPTMGSNTSMSRSLHLTPDRPDRPTRPGLPEKPKPPLRVKPQLMKKPSRSPEIVKRAQPTEAGDAELAS